MTRDSEKGKYLSTEGSSSCEYWIAIACSLQAFTLGCMIGWISPSVIILSASDSPIKTTIEGISNIAAALAIGHVLAPFVSSSMIDKLGRKKTLVLAGIPLIINWAMIYCAKDVWVLIAARILAGISFGACICAGPLYLGEIASAHRRGLIGSIGGVMLNIGILFSFIIVPNLSVSNTALVFLTISIIVEFLIYLLPESPYFLVMVGRDDDAEISLEKLRCCNDVSDELIDIKSTIINSSTMKSNNIINDIKKIFTINYNLRAFIITTIFVVPQQLGGYSTILIFSHVIFKDAGGKLISPELCPIGVAITQIISAGFTTIVFDKINRKKLIFYSGLIATICDIIIAFYFFIIEKLNIDISNYSIVLLISTMILVFAFNLGFTSMQMILIVEVYSTDIKATGACMTSLIGGILSIISFKMYLVVVESWNFGHSVPFMGFTIVTFLSTFALLYATPETKGKTFVEIQRLLAK